MAIVKKGNEVSEVNKHLHYGYNKSIQLEALKKIMFGSVTVQPSFTEIL